MSRTWTIGLATMSALADLHPDDLPLVPAFRDIGIEARPVIWNGPPGSWDGLDVCLIRSTWDYFQHLPEFLGWLRQLAAAGTRVWNPIPLVEWNSDKSYLKDLERQGIPIVPTVLPGPGESLEQILDREGWDRAVFKPSVSGGSWRTHAVERRSLPTMETIFRELRDERTVLVQPYMAQVETTGERSLIFLGGEFSHAVLRAASLAPEVPIAEGAPFAPSDAEQAFGRRVLSLLESPPLYARVDYVADAEGVPRLMELELIEPRLFFPSHPASANRLAELVWGELR
ncbi:MAG: hypothetical protein L3K03_00595 [Thermoplasmata archaeon]|nr:hypothetical protein [Thermoplasmata archaeon]